MQEVFRGTSAEHATRVPQGAQLPHGSHVRPRKTQQYRSIRQVILRTGTMDYPLGHGSIPMEVFIEHKLRAERFLVEGNGIRIRDESGRWYIDARSSCWNLGL